MELVPARTVDDVSRCADIVLLRTRKSVVFGRRPVSKEKNALVTFRQWTTFLGGVNFLLLGIGRRAVQRMN